MFQNGSMCLNVKNVKNVLILHKLLLMSHESGVKVNH